MTSKPIYAPSWRMTRNCSGRRCWASRWTRRPCLICNLGLVGSGLVRIDLVELSRRMLANYDARAQSTCDVELLDLTTHEAYALQAEIARLREQRGGRVIGYKVGCTSQ